MDINYLAIVGAGVISMIVGGVWYGPLFGKKWMEICGVSATDEVAKKQMQKEAMPLYGIQFALTLIQAYVLLNIIIWTSGKGIGIAFWMWLGFIMPTVAGGAMWNNNSKKMKWETFLIQAGYQLVVMLIFGFLFSMWK
jgi:Protein of unknown function (DUF1761)